MTFIHTLILSIVEGITEFLPISSTGHLILTSHFLNIQQTEFLKSFEVIIQLGAILAVIVFFWKKLLTNRSLWPKIISAFIPTAILGFLFYDFIKAYLLGNELITLVSLFVGGIILIIIEKYGKSTASEEKSYREITYKNAFIIGLFQSVSMIPGVSRAAATIIGGMIMGLPRTTAVEFSFFLAIPTMMAATGLDLIKTNFSFTNDEIILLLIGFFGAFITALFTIKFLLSFIQKHTFITFGIYRIILAIVYYFFLF
jgi:undecaprenyl-diphosphatase